MKTKDRKIWTEALRSGEYKQTKRYLHCDGGFCCLGVLLDVLAEGDWTSNHYLNPHSFKEDGSRMSVISFPPDSILCRLGLSYSAASTLSAMNDNGKSFNEIADWIDDNLSDG